MPEFRAISAIGGCRFGRSPLHEGVGSFHRPDRDVLTAAQPAREFRIAQRELAEIRLAHAVTQAKPFHVSDKAGACRRQVIDAAHASSLKGNFRTRQYGSGKYQVWNKRRICGIYPHVTLRAQLHIRMLAAGYNPKSLAEAAGVRQSFVADIFAGRSKNPRLQDLHRLAVVVGCTVEDLLPPQRLPLTRPRYDPRMLKLAELNAKLKDLSIKDLDMVIRLLDAVRPMRDRQSDTDAA